MFSSKRIHGILIRAALVVTTLAAVAGCRDEGGVTPPRPESRVHAFYYPWYGNPEVDGEYRHWRHDQMGDVPDRRTYPGGDDIGADFYPALGCYSSADPVIVQKHMLWAERAGVGTFCVSWWGIGSPEDVLLPSLFKSAGFHNMKISLHLEPFPGRDPASLREALAHLLGRFGDHQALYRLPGDGRPVCYVYDSYLTPPDAWAELLTPDGSLTIRGTDLDVIMLGLWVGEDDGPALRDGGFDGTYTYFATDGFTYGSTTANWCELADYSRENGLLFVPCVGPGYADLRIRPWNGANQREREGGDYYRRMTAVAVDLASVLIGLTSFNEWHEGTQIEPAASRALPDFTYRDYRPLGPNAYLDLTADWVGDYRRVLEGR